MNSLVSWPVLLTGSVVLIALFFIIERSGLMLKLKREIQEDAVHDVVNDRHLHVLRVEQLIDQNSLRGIQYLARHNQLVLQSDLTADEIDELNGLIKWLHTRIK